MLNIEAIEAIIQLREAIKTDKIVSIVNDTIETAKKDNEEYLRRFEPSGDQLKQAYNM